LVVAKDFSLLVTAAGDVIDGVWIIDPERSRHGGLKVKFQDLTPNLDCVVMFAQLRKSATVMDDNLTFDPQLWQTNGR
jgi:hypothetical protein